MERFAVLLLLASLWGCATPYNTTASSPAPTCECGPTQPDCGCSDDPRMAYAITQPSACNDYPVVHRVHTPREPDARVFPIDQIVVRAVGGVGDPGGVPYDCR